MPDMKSVMSGLEGLIDSNWWMFHSDSEVRNIAKEALELIKEREAVEPKKENDGNPEPWASWWYVCGDCGQPIDKMDRFCRRCGKQVKWE